MSRQPTRLEARVERYETDEERWSVDLLQPEAITAFHEVEIAVGPAIPDDFPEFMEGPRRFELTLGEGAVPITLFSEEEVNARAAEMTLAALEAHGEEMSRQIEAVIERGQEHIGDPREILRALRTLAEKLRE